jgi:hypothetical protein
MGVIGLAGLAVVAAACFGGSGSARSSRPAPPRTRVVIHQSVGLPVRSPAAITASCPALARCRPQRAPGVHPEERSLMATRTLTCGPDRGGYVRPAAACRALRDLVRLEAHPTKVACGCIVPVTPPSSIVGRVDGKEVSFTIDGCSLCGLPGQAGADAGVLVPG